MARLLGPEGLGLLAQTAPLLILTGATTAISAWFGYLRTVARERERTTRLRAAIDGAPPECRSDIIDSCGRLEASAAQRRWTPPAAPGRPRSRSGGRQPARSPRSQGADVA